LCRPRRKPTTGASHAEYLSASWVHAGVRPAGSDPNCARLSGAERQSQRCWSHGVRPGGSYTTSEPRTAAAFAEPHVEHGDGGGENHGAEDVWAQNERVPEIEAGSVAAARHQEGVGDHDYEEDG